MKKARLLSNITTNLATLADFIAHTYCRAKNNKLRMAAGYLAYVSLLSIVPLVTVIFAILSAFPVFKSMRSQIEDYIYSHFMPTSVEVVQTTISEFVDNASKGGVISIGVLIIFALMLISSIDNVLNRIWNSPKKRPIVISLSVYWMVITLGPLFVGCSLAISSYVIALGGISHGIMEYLLRWLPMCFSVLAFLMMYLMVPNIRVRLRDALIGAVVAALLFELTKSVFAIYISHFPSYQAIYGALATIPILFLWVYLSWIVVLIGAEVTAALPEFYAPNNASEPEQPLIEVIDNEYVVSGDKTV